MGAGDESSPDKHAKPTLSAQEAPTSPSYPDWSNMQAYYGVPSTPPFFASTIPSPTPHPYMWGGQHPMMPPYGTPVPYPALYPPAGVYGHPSMTSTPSTTPAAELEGKSSEGKERAISKKSKGARGNTNNIGGRSGESVKAASSSRNDGATQSAESGSDCSSDGSDGNNDRHEFHGNKKGSFHQMLAEATAQNNTSGPTVPSNPVVPGTNLNIGMDSWNASGGSGAIKGRPNVVVGREGMVPDQWGQDERELKRQKRKQSNRESARRSRLRKQVECEELQTKVESLSSENHTLRDELQRLSEDCQKLTSENKSMKDGLTRLCGPEAVSKLDNNNNSTLPTQSRGDEGNS